MSEEEKKAIAEVKDVIEYDKEHRIVTIYDKQPLFRDTLQTLLNLIEKQQKEIEELREEKAKRQWVHIKENGEVEPLFYVSEDKIKAKIEPKLKELDEQINEEWKKYGNSKELQDMEDMYNFLQSLLEKE